MIDKLKERKREEKQKVKNRWERRRNVEKNDQRP